MSDEEWKAGIGHVNHMTCAVQPGASTDCTEKDCCLCQERIPSEFRGLAAHLRLEARVNRKVASKTKDPSG